MHCRRATCTACSECGAATLSLPFPARPCPISLYMKSSLRSIKLSMAVWAQRRACTLHAARAAPARSPGIFFYYCFVGPPGRRRGYGAACQLDNVQHVAPLGEYAQRRVGRSACRTFYYRVVDFLSFSVLFLFPLFNRRRGLTAFPDCERTTHRTAISYPLLFASNSARRERATRPRRCARQRRRIPHTRAW